MKVRCLCGDEKEFIKGWHRENYVCMTCGRIFSGKWRRLKCEECHITNYWSCGGEDNWDLWYGGEDNWDLWYCKNCGNEIKLYIPSKTLTINMVRESCGKCGYEVMMNIGPEVHYCFKCAVIQGKKDSINKLFEDILKEIVI